MTCLYHLKAELFHFLHKYPCKLFIILKPLFPLLTSPDCGQRRWLYTDGHWQCFGKTTEEHRLVTILQNQNIYLYIFII